MTQPPLRFLCLALLLLILISAAPPAGAENWPSWRGPRGDGTSLEKGVPRVWSGTENVVWKVPIPGPGHDLREVGQSHGYAQGP
ncbi:MAG: hypothetical protein ACYC35_24715 [Pirellulales bacterium]